MPVKMLNSWKVINWPGLLSKDFMIAQYSRRAELVLRPVMVSISFIKMVTLVGLLISLSAIW
jgi:hypothetical protein